MCAQGSRSARLHHRIAGEVRRGVELEVPLVVELEECRGVGMLLLEVEVVELGLLCRVAAVLAHINLFDGQMVTYLFGRLQISRLTFDLLCLYSYWWDIPCTLRLCDSREHL